MNDFMSKLVMWCKIIFEAIVQACFKNFDVDVFRWITALLLHTNNKLYNSKTFKTYQTYFSYLYAYYKIFW